MSVIVKYEWDLGNGTTSSSPTPHTTYFPGVYTVTLKVTTDDGNTYTAYESEFIAVAEDQQNLFTEKYLSDPRSYHFGVNESVSTGWSRNSGNNWVWPESQASISHITINGITCLLVWDMYDDIQYCINPRNTSFSAITHLDKGSHEIECSATFGGVLAASAEYDIMHQETTVHLRKDIDSQTRPTGMDVFMSLIDDDGTVLEKVKVVTGSEIVFKDQSVYLTGEMQSVQVKFETSKSGYQLTSFESIYKTNDKSTASQVGQGDDTATSIADVSTWITSTGDYAVDLATGAIPSLSASLVNGPNSHGNAISLSGDLDIGNEATIGTLLMWYSGTEPLLGLEMINQSTTDSFTLITFTGSIPANITVPNGNTIYDIRITSEELTAYAIADYASNYRHHIGD